MTVFGLTLVSPHRGCHDLLQCLKLNLNYSLASYDDVYSPMKAEHTHNNNNFISQETEWTEDRQTY